MLTAKTDTIDVVEGLEAGADDYVAKPFKAKELVARIKLGSAGCRPRRRSTLRLCGSGISRSAWTAFGEAGWGTDPAHTFGVRPLAGLGSTAVAGLQSRGVARAGVGLPPCRRHAGWSTYTCSGCVQRSRRIPSTPRCGDCTRDRLQGRRNQPGPIAGPARRRSYVNVGIWSHSEDAELPLVAVPHHMVVAIVAASRYRLSSLPRCWCWCWAVSC